MVQPTDNDNEIAIRAAARFEEQTRRSHEQTDRLFLVLMPLQWLAGVALAWFVSPRTWDGLSSRLHPHIWASVLLGGLFSILPIIFICRRPGTALTRQSITLGQMLT